MSTKNNLIDKLKYTDLIGLLRRVGREKDLGAEIYKYLLHTHKIYGSDYIIRLSKQIVTHPQHFGAIFPSRLGKIYFIKYASRLYKSTKDKNYLNAISDYQEDSDSRIASVAKQTMEKIVGE